MNRNSTFLMRTGLQSALLLLMTLMAFSQSKKITGRVFDARDNTPLPGVTVQIKGTSSGTQSGSDGTYTLEVPGNNTVLIFSFVGYNSQEKSVANSTIVNAALSTDVKSLQDIVVVGYGTQRRSDLTGAVASVKAATLQERPAPSVNQALSGRIPGVQINTNSGRPGGQTNVRVRGFSSINTTNNPLYVIDGVALPVGSQTQNSNAIDFINGNDIESIDVLKDASATAIYGARGANGVIIITTKHGSAVGGRVTYDTYLGKNEIGPHRVKMLNAKEYLAVEDLAWKNSEIYDPAGWAAGDYIARNPALKRTDKRLFDKDGNPLYDTDWLKESVQTNKLTQSHQLGFTGGNADTQYGIFLGYLDDNGLLLNSYLKRYSARFTIDSKVKEWLKVGGSISYNNQEENLVDIGTGGLNSVRMITEGLPFLPIKFQDGTWSNNKVYPGAEGGSNPVQILTDRKYILNTQNLLGNAYATLSLAKGLELRSVLGTNVVTRGRQEYMGRSLLDISASQGGIAILDNQRESFWSFENYLTYNKKVKDHSFTGLLGLSWQENNVFGFNARAENFSTDYFAENKLGAGSNIPASGVDSRRRRYAFNSYFARFNYAYKERYLFTLTGRADGSSRFGANHKYAMFPSAALAWRATEEPFLKDNRILSNLKLRTSFGVTGNSELDPYKSLATLAANTDYAAVIGGAKVQGVGTNRLANPDLKWEKTAQYDFGVEIGILKNRINLEADVYYRKTSDMLLDAPVATTSGYTTITKNAGTMENKGLELGLNALIIDKKDFSWSTIFNISFNRNKVLSLATPADIFGIGGPNFTNQTNIIRVGEPVGSFWGLVRLGTWSTAEAAEAAKFKDYRGGKPILPGDIKYLDVNGDHAITDADRMIIGNGNPKGWGGFINTFKYKNLDLTIELQYTFGNDVLNMTHHSGEDRTGLANSFASVLDYWTPQNQNTMIAAPRNPAAGYVTNVDTRWVEDGSFIRGKNLLLGYTFNHSVIEKLHLSRLRIYTSVQNFFLKTKFSGNDPEVTTYTNAFAQGQTFFDYPKPTTYILGLNVAF